MDLVMELVLIYEFLKAEYDKVISHEFSRAILSKQ